MSFAYNPETAQNLNAMCAKSDAEVETIEQEYSQISTTPIDFAIASSDELDRFDETLSEKKNILHRLIRADQRNAFFWRTRHAIFMAMRTQGARTQQDRKNFADQSTKSLADLHDLIDRLCPVKPRFS